MMMAEEFEDGEFWLPSEILTDDDILMDLDLPSSGSVTASTESETDEDDLLLKALVLSSSPQSTLYGLNANQGSSRGSPAGLVSPPSVVGKGDAGTTWDLLYNVAGEVARIKLRSETAAKVGTGFFDCSTKRPLCSNYPSLHLHPHFPPLSYTRQQQGRSGVQSNRLRKESFNNTDNSLLGLPPSAWPPLKAQKQQSVAGAGPPMFMFQPVAKRESVGTGVFLPRRPTETRKNPEANGTKERNGKGGPKSQQQRTSRLPTSA